MTKPCRPTPTQRLAFERACWTISAAIVIAALIVTL